MTTFRVNDLVTIKSHVGGMSRAFQDARDTETPVRVNRVDMTGETFQVKCEIVFEDGDRLECRFAADELEFHSRPFLPTTGDLFTRPGNDKYALLVISAEQQIVNGGWIVYGMMVWLKRGDPVSYSAPRLLSVYKTDRHQCYDFPLPEAAALALTRRNAIIEKSARGESLNDDDHHNMTLCGMAVTFPKLAARRYVK